MQKIFVKHVYIRHRKRTMFNPYDVLKHDTLSITLTKLIHPDKYNNIKITK